MKTVRKEENPYCVTSSAKQTINTSEQTRKIIEQQEVNVGQIKKLLSDDSLWLNPHDPTKTPNQNAPAKAEAKATANDLSEQLDENGLQEMTPKMVVDTIRELAKNRGLNPYNDLGGTAIGGMFSRYLRIKTEIETNRNRQAQKRNNEAKKRPPRTKHSYVNTYRADLELNTFTMESDFRSLSPEQQEKIIINDIVKKFNNWLPGVNKEHLNIKGSLNEIPRFSDAYHNWVRYRKNEMQKCGINEQIFDEMEKKLMEFLKYTLEEYLHQST